MSWSVSLFVDGASSLQALAAEDSTFSGIPLEYVNDDDGTRFRYYGRDFRLILLEDHGMENDRDMNFQDYRYDVSLWRNNTPKVTQAQANTLEFATTLFQKFKETGRYRLMLVENVQKKLAFFG